MEEKVSFRRSFGVALLCWTAVAIIQGWGMFVDDRDHANYLPYAHYFVWTFADAYSWAILTPFIFAFSRRFPFQRERWLLRSVQYVLLTGAVILIRPALVVMGWFYLPDQHASFLSTLWQLGQKETIATFQVSLVLYLLAAHQNAKREARWRRVREAELESRVSNAELQMLRMQLHPHFLFNALQAAKVLVYEDPAGAENVLQRLSELLRVALDDTRSYQVPLRQEIEFLENYVEIQKQRFQDRLEVRFDIADETLSVPVPSLLLQPLVENAIHHGIGKRKGSDVVDVSARRDGDMLLLEVRNFASELVANAEPSGHGVGLRSIRARLEQMYGKEASVSLSRIDSLDALGPLAPRGVCARVTLPMEPAA